MFKITGHLIISSLHITGKKLLMYYYRYVETYQGLGVKKALDRVISWFHGS